MGLGGVALISRMRQHPPKMSINSPSSSTLITPNDIDRWIILTFLNGRKDQLQPVRPRHLIRQLTSTILIATTGWTMTRLLLSHLFIYFIPFFGGGGRGGIFIIRRVWLNIPVNQLVSVIIDPDLMRSTSAVPVFSKAKLNSHCFFLVVSLKKKKTSIGSEICNIIL